MHLTTFSTLFASVLFIVTAAANIPRQNQKPNVPVLRNVTQFPNGTWVENLAVRGNGQLMVTLLSAPELYQVDPVGKEKPQLIYKFPNATGLTGISEIEKDVFAVVAGNLSLTTFTSPPGSYSVWKVDMRSFKSRTKNQSSTAKVAKIADIPEAKLLNGMTALDKGGNVLISDSAVGVVWRLDTRSGDRKIVIDDPLMKPAPGPAALGINGIQIRNNTLYFTNTFGLTFNKVPINPNGTATAAASLVAKNGVGDDFTFDRSGNAFVAQNPSNALQKITPEGTVSVLAGSQNSTELVGPTAAQFGKDKATLFITTNGGLAGPVNGTFTEGGKVVAFDLRG